MFLGAFRREASVFWGATWSLNIFHPVKVFNPAHFYPV